MRREGRAHTLKAIDARGRMKGLKKVLDKVKDATVEQRERAKEIVQSALNDGHLEVEFAIKEKNRRLLAP